MSRSVECGHDATLRADAERNRDRITAAARRLYATEGLGVSMAAVAREAGVGKATLSRRFATREDLIDAVFADRMDGYAAATAEALADPDPWRAFTRYIENICAMQAADRGFAAVLAMSFPAAVALEARRAESYQGFLQLIDRAKATGTCGPTSPPRTSSSCSWPTPMPEAPSSPALYRAMIRFGRPSPTAEVTSPVSWRPRFPASAGG